MFHLKICTTEDNTHSGKHVILVRGNARPEAASRTTIAFMEKRCLILDLGPGSNYPFAYEPWHNLRSFHLLVVMYSSCKNCESKQLLMESTHYTNCLSCVKSFYTSHYYLGLQSSGTTNMKPILPFLQQVPPSCTIPFHEIKEVIQLLLTTSSNLFIYAVVKL